MLGEPAFRDVGVDADHADRLTGIVTQHNPAGAGPADAAIGAKHPKFDRIFPFARQRGGKFALKVVLVSFMDQIPESFERAFEATVLHAGGFQQAFRPYDLARNEIPVPRGCARRGEGQPQALLLHEQLVLGDRLGGDVAQDARNDAPAIDHESAGLVAHPAFGSIDRDDAEGDGVA